MASNWTEEDLKALEAKRTKKKTAPATPAKPNADGTLLLVI